MKLALRFILPLTVVLGSMAYGLLPVLDKLTMKWFVRDLDIRSRLIANTIQEPLGDLVRSGSSSGVLKFFDRAIQDERLFALGFCDEQNRFRFKTQTLPPSLRCEEQSVGAGDSGEVVHLPQGPVHVAVHHIEADGKSVGRLVLVHDMSFVERRSNDTKKYVFYLFVALGVVISFIDRKSVV